MGWREVDLNKIIINQNDTIREAIRKVEGNGINAVFAVDDCKRLKGSVSDGDLRRAVLKGTDLDLPVKIIMNVNPTILKERIPLDQLHSLMIEKCHLAIPLVKQNRIVDCYHLKDVSIKLVRKSDTVLVIGGAGYIGSVLVRRLLLNGYSVRVFDALLYGGESVRGLGSKNCELVVGDIRSTKKLEKAIRGCWAVVHLGEIVGDPACALNEDYAIDVNVKATQNIVEVCHAYGAEKFVFSSSASVYGQCDKEVNEGSELNPQSLYAKCKIESEKAILNNTNAMKAVILRLATVFGHSPRMRFDLVVNRFVAQAVNDDTITVYGGKQWRPFVDVEDVAGVIQTALESDVSGVYNVGAGNYRIESIVGVLEKWFPGIKEETRWKKGEDTRNYRVEFDKLCYDFGDRLGFHCDISLHDGVERLIDMVKSGGVDYRDRKYSNYKSLKGD